MTLRTPRLACIIMAVICPLVVQAAEDQWTLPEGIDIDLSSLQASSNQRSVLFIEKGTSSRIDILRRVFPSAYWLLDTQSGQLKNLLEPIDAEEAKDKGRLMVRICGLSANGKYAMLLIAKIKQSQASRQKKAGYNAYVVTLADADVQKIGEKVISAAWVGNKAAISRFVGKGSNREIDKITLFDPKSQSQDQLDIRGMIVCGHLDGRMLVYGCDPDNPPKGLKERDLRKADMVVITTDGQVLRDLGIVPPAGARPDQLVLSPDGKFVAFREGRLKIGRKARNVKVRLMTTSGELDITFNEVGTPIDISDDGKVVVMGHVLDTDEGAPVKVLGISDDSRTIVTGAGAAAVGGNRLFYLIQGQQTLIKSVPLDR